MNDWQLLLHIAEKGGLYGHVDSSTAKIANSFGVSQQTISRKLIHFEKKGWVKRRVTHLGMGLELTQSGREELKIIFSKLGRLFENKTQELKGKVKSGIGEGAYYVKQYQPFLQKKLGFKAFPGTLNLQVDETLIVPFVDGLDKVEVPAFKTAERSFGHLDCYMLNLKGHKVALVLPERTRHKPEIVELIAPIYLRKKLRLKDNSVLKLRR
jgi:riboflavin kinase